MITDENHRCLLRTAVSGFGFFVSEFAGLANFGPGLKVLVPLIWKPIEARYANPPSILQKLQLSISSNIQTP